MSLLTLWSVEWLPTTIAPAVYLSVVIRAAVERPSGTSHFISLLPTLNGAVQIARWSRRMFRKKRLSSVGVGLACGVGWGCGSVPPCELCAEVLSAMRIIRAQLAATDRNFEPARVF